MFLASLFFLASSQPDISVQELVEKNIQTAGGNDKLARVENFSFKAGSMTFYMSSDGRMKITEGRDPVITEVILVGTEKVKRNCFNNRTEIKEPLKSTYQCLAKLRCGLFTLARFRDQLEFHGLKTFGPEKHYILSTNVNDLEVNFYLDHQKFIIKRVVFKGFTSPGNIYEVNHDFGPLQEVEGIKIPSSWFSSQVGTRGLLHEISDVKINQPLEKDFFSNLEINAGEVEISSGALSGNVVEFALRRSLLTLSTNWTNQCIMRAGFKNKDKLILQIHDKEIEIDFYDSRPPRNATRPGSRFMMPDSRNKENYLIYLWSEEFKDLAEKMEPLLPIHVKKKS